MDIPQALQYLFEATDEELDEELDGHVDLDMLLKVVQRLKDIASRKALSPRTCITLPSNDKDPTESTLTNNTQNLVAVKRKEPKEKHVCIIEDLQKNISWLWNLRNRHPKHIIEAIRVENRDRRIVDIAGIDGKKNPTANERLFLCIAQRSLAIQYLEYESSTNRSRLGDIHKALRCPELSEEEKKDLLSINRTSLVPSFVKDNICLKEHADYKLAVRSVNAGIKQLASETDLEYQLRLSNKAIHTCALSVITSISKENFRRLAMGEIVNLSDRLCGSCMISEPDNVARTDVLDLIHQLSPWFDSLQSYYDTKEVSCCSALRSIPTEHYDAEPSNDYHSERRSSSDDSTFEDDIQSSMASSVVTDLIEGDNIEQSNQKRQHFHYSEGQSSEQHSGNRPQVPETNSTPQSEERQDNARTSLPPISSLFPPTVQPAASPGGHALENVADSAYTTRRPLVPTPILSDFYFLPPDASTSSPDLQQPELSNVSHEVHPSIPLEAFDANLQSERIDNAISSHSQGESVPVEPLKYSKHPRIAEPELSRKRLRLGNNTSQINNQTTPGFSETNGIVDVDVARILTQLYSAEPSENQSYTSSDVLNMPFSVQDSSGRPVSSSVSYQEPTSFALGVHPSTNMDFLDSSDSEFIAAMGIHPATYMDFLDSSDSEFIAALGVHPARNMDFLDSSDSEFIAALGIHPSTYMDFLDSSNDSFMAAYSTVDNNNFTGTSEMHPAGRDMHDACV
jgi:hypothetical protein